MNEFNKKTRIIIICVCSVLVGAILYYVYGREEIENTNEIIPYEETEENKEITEANGSEEEKNEIIIYITGEINKEGVYKLEEGSRIADAIELAGGLTDEADTKEINLAYIIEDGMKIKIPNKTEQQEKSEYITKESGIEVEVIENAKSNTTSNKVNINTATQEQLETLTGIGPSTANKIIEHRKKNGNFKKIEDIKNVSGIGESKYNKIKEQIIVKP